MAAVLLTPPYLQFFDANGLPLAGGKLFSYTAGTITPKATYTDAGGLTPNSNPVVLDASGRASVWISGSYKFILQDSAGNTISTTDNVTAFSAAGSLTPASIGTAQMTLSSNTTTDLGTVTTQNALITGTTTITSLGSSASTASPLYYLEFAAPLTLTYNATSLIIPGGASVITAAGDTALAEYLGSGNWRIRSYMKASGLSVVGGAPTFQYLTTGTAATYTTRAGATALRIRMIGGGGGGSGFSANSGIVGGNTIFNSINATGGGGGTFAGAGGVGGTGGSGSAAFRKTGAAGQGAVTGEGGEGAASIFGSGGFGISSGAGSAASTNSGAGGAGGGGTSTQGGGSGGGAGEYVEIYITSPAATYTYTIGAGGNGGAAGTFAGGNGGSGYIEVTEY